MSDAALETKLLQFLKGQPAGATIAMLMSELGADNDAVEDAISALMSDGSVKCTAGEPTSVSITPVGLGKV
ncbi:MAG: hypothetical protein IAF08_10715 [Rhizobacter sp.]|nr:hypothetical protein [Chlorobiales bacterium]